MRKTFPGAGKKQRARRILLAAAGTAALLACAGCASGDPLAQGTAWGPALVPSSTPSETDAIAVTAFGLTAGTEEWGETLRLDDGQQGWIFLRYSNSTDYTQDDVTLRIELVAPLVLKPGSVEVRGTDPEAEDAEFETITDSVTGEGALVGSFAAGEGAELRFEVTVDPAVACGTTEGIVTAHISSEEREATDLLAVTVLKSC